MCLLVIHQDKYKSVHKDWGYIPNVSVTVAVLTWKRKPLAVVEF